jgi:membrane protein DedA with SNARE-associated domain
MPIPDVVSVPLGITKYNPWKFGTAIFTGKFIFNEVIVWSAVILGRPFINRLGLLGSSTINSTYLFIAIAIGVVTIAIIIYLSLRIDWAKIIGKWFPRTLDKN